jgi:hypothetical protein
MVDALRRAHRAVDPGGFVLDVHPTAAPSAVEVGIERVGYVSTDAPLRHAAAGAALARSIDEGWFAVDGAREFTFYSYGDSIDELREYVVDNWRDADIDAAVVARARHEAATNAYKTVRIVEHVRLTRLRPLH